MHLSPLAQAQSLAFARFAYRSKDNTFTCPSTWLQKTYGNRYASGMAELLASGALEIVRGYHFDPTGKKMGRCTTYKFNHTVETAATATVNLPADYLALRNRTNIASLYPAPFYTEGRNGDGRIYNDFTSLPKAELPSLTLDGETLVQFDVANAFPLFLGNVIHAGKEYMTVARTGRLYDVLVERLATEGVNISRQNAKLAVQKIINAPKNLNFGELYVSGGAFFRVQTAEAIEQKSARLMFEHLFPKEYKAFRTLARSGQSYILGSKQEAMLRKTLVKRAETMGISIIPRHDAVLVKESDAARVFTILSSLPCTFAISGNSTFSPLSSSPSSSSHLICTDATNPDPVGLFFTFEDPESPHDHPNRV